MPCSVLDSCEERLMSEICDAEVPRRSLGLCLQEVMLPGQAASISTAEELATVQ